MTTFDKETARTTFDTVHPEHSKKPRKPRVSRPRKPYQYNISFTEEQNALLNSLRKEDVAENDSLSSYIARTLLEYSRLRQQVKDLTSRSPSGRPPKSKDLAPEDDPSRPKTIRNPYIDDDKDPNYLVNEYELAIAHAMHK